MSWTLPELIDIPNLQMLMDRFHAATGIPVGIIAIDGQILVATGWQEICTAFHRTHPVTAERCRQSDDYIKTRLATENYVQYKCRNGLWDLAVPIIIAGKHVATLFLGQFNYDDEEIDEEFFLGQARELGFDLDRYMAALRRIPVFTREKVRRIMDFYASFVDFLVSVGLANYRQGETEKTLRESEEKFAKAFHTAPISMTISTIEEGQYLEVSEAFERLTGYTADEAVGRTALEFGFWHDPLERQEIVALLEREGEVRDREFTLRDRGGELRAALFSGVVINLHGEKRILSLVNDITERKRVEEALRESEERYRTLFEGANDTIFTIRDGCIVNCNRKALEMFGCTMEEFIGNRPEQFSPPMQPDGIDSAAKAREKITAALAGPPQFFEWRHHRSDGTTFDAEVSLNRLECQGNTELLAIIRDITERKRAEEALRESERRYREIFDNTSDCIFLLDVTSDGRFKFAGFNPAEENAVGFSSSEVSGRFIEDVVPEEIAKEPISHYRHCVETGTLINYDEELNLPVGLRHFHTSLIPLRDAAGRIYRIIGIARDITERKRAEEALRESEEKFAKAFSSTPSLLVISTIAEGRYIEVNESFERFTGYRREEAIGRTSIELNIWEAETRTRFLEAIRKEGRVRDFEANFRSKSGEHHAGLLSAEVIEIKGEQRLLVLVNDITARKRMEEEIEILNTDLASHAMELEAANRELEAFNYTVSHDLRSPLTGITGYSQILLDSFADRLGDPCMGYVREIHEAAERMEQLIDTLLSFSRLLRCTITRETVDLTGMAKVVAAQLKMTAPCRQVAFTVEEGVKAEGDAKLLRVVVENLLGNAWKYTGNRETALIEFGVAEINGGPAYFVRDNGAGFDMAHADKLFNPFQRLPGTTEFAGHGIGLATVQRIIQRHGGRVWAEGEPAEGAAFYFTLLP